MALSAHPDPTSPVLSHFSLEGKAALVTGGSRGFGLEVVRGLLEAGASVGFTYSSTKSDEVASLVEFLAQENKDRTVKAYRCNVTDRAAAEIGEGILDIVVANAGIAEHIPAEEYREDEFRQMLDVNMNGAFWTAQAAAKIMKGRKTRGSIISTLSVSGILVNVPQTQAAYNASKAGLIHLAKSLAVEWTNFACVNCVSLGFIATEMLEVHPKEWREKWFSMIPSARLCLAPGLKGSYVYLASDASSYTAGANLVIDGGYTLP